MKMIIYDTGKGKFMSQIIIPDNYHSSLNLYDTQIGIKTVKDFFQSLLAERLNLLKFSILQAARSRRNFVAGLKSGRPSR